MTCVICMLRMGTAGLPWWTQYIDMWWHLQRNYCG